MKKKNRILKFIPILLILILVCIPLAGESGAADLELDDPSGCIGGSVIFMLSVNNAPGEVASLGMDIGFNPTVLQYDSIDFTETLIEGFDFKNANVIEPGVLRLGAFEAGGDKIQQSASGVVAKITFNVIGDEDHSLPLGELKDDIAGWSAKDGSFFYLCFGIEPTGVTICEGASAKFTVVPQEIGIPPFTWRINGEIDQSGESRMLERRFLESGIYTVSVEDSSVPALFAQAIATVLAEDDSGALNIMGGRGNAGDTVTIFVQVQSAPNQVAALGFDVVYDPIVLTYVEYAEGELVQDFDFFDANLIGPGRIRIGGFEAGEHKIPSGASGIVVKLTFDVICDQCISSFIEPEAPKDHMALWSLSGGCSLLCCGCCPGDVNRDGDVTPMDALCAFETYLLICPTTCGISCEDICCDVNEDEKCTPADALCIFKKYLVIPSCCD